MDPPVVTFTDQCGCYDVYVINTIIATSVIVVKLQILQEG